MSNAIRNYLAAYNFIAFVFWTLYLVWFIASGLEFSDTALSLLCVAQGLAVLEILHVLLKWVKSPVLSTIAQVMSRLLVVFVILAIRLFPHENFSNPAVLNVGIIIVSFAWSITEIIRYSFYFLSLFNKQPKWLLWMRYSFFIALYPLGVTGEWLIIISPIVVAKNYFSLYSAFVIMLFAAYAYYFPVLYKYMWKQRKLKL
jgi:hypothetical protein